MASLRCLRPLAELATRQSQVALLRNPSTLTVASRKYYNCSCRNVGAVFSSCGLIYTNCLRIEQTYKHDTISHAPIHPTSNLHIDILIPLGLPIPTQLIPKTTTIPTHRRRRRIPLRTQKRRRRRILQPLQTQTPMATGHVQTLAQTPIATRTEI